MNYHYVVVREDYLDDAHSRTAYGIAAVEECDGCPAVMQSVSDVCADFAPVQELVQCCNELQLDLIHLYDVVEDFLIMTL